jgi:hypothetical protein
MRGGVNIGSGTDGCVFDVQFDESGKVKPGSEKGGTGIATKVYKTGPNGELNPAAVNEYNIMMKVRKATNGLGVVTALDGTLRKLESIDSSEIKTIALLADGKAQGACNYLIEPGNSPYTVLELPLVSGAVAKFTFGSLTEPAFSNMKSALSKMKGAKITQLDLAARNVFYSSTGAADVSLMVADFGNGIDLNTPSEKRFADFGRLVKRYSAYPHTVILRDGFHYKGYLYMIAVTFFGLAMKKTDVSASMKLWDEVKYRFEQTRDEMDTLSKSEYCRILRTIDSFAPEPIVIAPSEDDLLNALNDLPEPVEQEVPVAATQAPVLAPVIGGEVPDGYDNVELDREIEELTKDYRNYESERNVFITGYITDIKTICDKLSKISFDKDNQEANRATFDSLMEEATKGILESDGLMYEFIHAVYLDGSLRDRLKTLNRAWGYAPAEGPKGGTVRRRTYRKKRVKMSRRK